MILLSFILQGCQKNETVNNEIIIIFRLDDYSPFSHTHTEIQIFESFAKHSYKLNLAVIPFTNNDNQHSLSAEDYSLDSIKENLLKEYQQRQIIEIALHGYNHKAIDYNKTYLTEFKDLDYELQYNRINIGKSYLEGIIEEPINIFVPPWNSYDKNTILALSNSGFTILSADTQGEYLKNNDIAYIPFTCELYQLKDLINKIENSAQSRPACIIALFHPTDYFSTYDAAKHTDTKSLDSLLTYIRSKNNIRVMTLNEYMVQQNELSYSRLKYNTKIHNLKEYLPPFLNENLYYQYYSEKDRYIFRQILLKLSLYYIVLFVVSIFLYISSLKLVKLLFLKIKISEKNLEYLLKLYRLILGISSLILVIYAVHDFDINYRGLSVLIFMSGIIISLFTIKPRLKNLNNKSTAY